MSPMPCSSVELPVAGHGDSVGCSACLRTYSLRLHETWHQGAAFYFGGAPRMTLVCPQALACTPGITADRRRSFYLPTHKLHSQPPAAWPRANLLAPRRCCSELQLWNFSWDSLGHFLASSLFSRLMDCPFPNTRMFRSLNWRKLIFSGDAVCFPRMSLSGHCVPTQSAVSMFGAVAPREQAQ